MRRALLFMVLAAVMVVVIGCSTPKVKLFSDETEPLKEFTLLGEKKEKVLLIPINGFISDAPRREFFQPKPSMVQEIVSQLQRAEKDKNIRAVLLKIDSPGGSTTASDILYHEILAYKNRTNVKVVAVMMNLAASGGYYVSLPADVIIAHPTTVTGSIGVIFIYSRITGLMEKIGVDVEVSKSGKNKDMASPFREPTEEERRMLQNITETLGKRFVNLVVKYRKLPPDKTDKISTARVFLPEEALALGLIDEIGYLSDAISKAKFLADLPEDAKVVVYRRTEYPDDNLYNPSTSSHGIRNIPLFDLGIPKDLSHLRTGFYYLWVPGGSL